MNSYFFSYAKLNGEFGNKAKRRITFIIIKETNGFSNQKKWYILFVKKLIYMLRRAVLISAFGTMLHAKYF